MAHSLAARYRDRTGAQHEVRIEQAASGFWRVLDAGPDGERLVEELTGSEDHRPQAEALARDYAGQAALAVRGDAHEQQDSMWAA